MVWCGTVWCDDDDDDDDDGEEEVGNSKAMSRVTSMEMRVRGLRIEEGCIDRMRKT